VIGSIPRYANLSARVRTLAGYLIQGAQWHTLLSMPDLASLADALAHLPYGRDWPYAEPPSLRRLELYFSQAVAREYEKFMAITSGEVRGLLRELWRRFELDNLKAILRHLAEERAVPIEEVIIPLARSDLPLARLSEAADLRTAADVLSDTVYGPPLADALPRYESENTLFPIEVALDINHWRRVWRAVTRLGGADQNWARRLVGHRLDTLNITWAFRYRIYYHLSEEEIINYTLPYGYRSDDTVLRAIAGGAGIRDVIVQVWGEEADEFANLTAAGSSPEGTPAGDSSTASVRDNLRAFEVALARLECRLAHDPFKSHPFQIGLLLGYLLLKECEAHDLIILAESKAEALPAREIEPYLVSYSG
jgi:vacuolar-type H+-ATPase subunit C/Vma6